MITDELREWKGHIQTRLAPEVALRAELNAIADRIDAEHESACAEAYGNGVMSVPIALDESAYVELPKDADGECIHIGDVMDSKVDYLFDGKPFMVRAMRYDEGGWEVYDRLGDRYMPSLLRHHKPPTVEDVLSDFARLYDSIGGRENEDELWETLLAEYASKLQLKENS